MSISANYARIRREIPDYVTMVVSCKTRTAEEIKQVIDAGATDIGENYVQEAGQMYSALKKDATKVRWHMVGCFEDDRQMEAYMGVKFPQRPAKKFSGSRSKAKCS